jgi:predicted nucleotidyltransferase
MRRERNSGEPTLNTSGPGSSILTSTQSAFLRAFFEIEARALRDETALVKRRTTCEGFLLAGGTALAGFYLYHRYSDDIDLFTFDESVFQEGKGFVEEALAQLGLVLERRESSGPYVKFTVSGDPVRVHPLEKVELVLDSPPRFSDMNTVDSVRIMGLLDLTIAKLSALGREEVKDFIDLYFIAKDQGVDVLSLLPLVKQKDMGLTEGVLAQDALKVLKLREVAAYLSSYMIKEVDWDDLTQFYKDLAGRIFDLFPSR